MIETHEQPQEKKNTSLKRPAIVLLIALVIMIVFNYLVWERQWGLQFFLTTVMILIGLVILVIIEKKKVPVLSYLLLIPILFGSLMTFIRADFSTTFFNVILTLVSLLLLAITLFNGQRLQISFRWLFKAVPKLVSSVFVSPIQSLINHKKAQTDPDLTQKHKTREQLKAYLRGVLIALPILLLLGALLASADLVFSERLSNLFDWIKIEDFSEFVVRTIYILVLAYLLAGAYIHALTKSDERIHNDNESTIKPILGHVEAFIVLVLVNLLFLSFIVIQFRYFFAGESNISLEGFTYAEYARRGFFELIAVAMISLVIFYLLSLFTKRQEPKLKRFFSALGILLILQVGLMLISAFQRLSLYETAYGFTTLRTITHVFMIWLGILLIAAALMEIFNQFERMAVVLFLVFFGFTLTLNFLNVDRFIARRNIEHAIAGNPLDARYLVWDLGADGISEIFERKQDEDIPQDIKEKLDATLACYYAAHQDQEMPSHWAEWHYAKAKANTLFNDNQTDLEAYPFLIRTENSLAMGDGVQRDFKVTSYYILVEGDEIWCKTEENELQPKP